MSKGLLYITVAIFILISACDLFNRSKKNIVITVGKRDITADEFKRDIKRMTLKLGITDHRIGYALKPLVNKMIDDYLIMEYSRIKGITISKKELESAVKDIKKDYPGKIFKEMLLHRYIDLKEWKEEFRRQLLIKKIISQVPKKSTPITFHEIKTYYDSHRQEFKHPQMAKFRQIVTKTREEAKEIRKRLSKGENFEELAINYSITFEAKNGGEVGWVFKGELEETMEKAIFSLPADKISHPKKTPYGYHIFQVLQKRPQGFKNLSEAMRGIEKKLTQQKKESIYKEWLKKLGKIFAVKVNQEAIRRLEFG